MLNLFKKYVFALCVLVMPVCAHASLLITPLQVVLQEKDRTTEIVLVNTSNETKTYRLRWEQLDQIDGVGGYVPVEEAVRKERLDLEDFAVFTPRQITLGPNEKQTIRLAVRRPADLPEGEYKTHLKFAIVPNVAPKEDDRKLSQNEIGIGAKVVASYSIPVVYRAGDYDTKITIGMPNISRNPKTSNIIIMLPMDRSGKHGAIGLINVYYTPEGGQETEIGALGNASLYSEIKHRDFTIVTQEQNLQPGQLRIAFTKAEGDVKDYVVMEEETFPIGR